MISAEAISYRSHGSQSGYDAVIHYESLDYLRLNRNTLYIVFGYGSGDTFTAMIHLRKAPPVGDYELIVKVSQWPLVQYLLGLFDHQPVRVHVVDYWQNDFAKQIANRHPSLSFACGVAAHANRIGLLDFWHDPVEYQKFLPLSALDIELLIQRFAQIPPQRSLPDGSVVLFPEANSIDGEYSVPWQKMVRTLREAGCKHIYVNQSGLPKYKKVTIMGATPLCLPHDELIRTFYAGSARLRIIAVRSGVLDILRFSRQRALVLYQPDVKDGFESHRFGLLQHNLDLIEAVYLNDTPTKQDEIIDFYLRHFLASPLRPN